MFGFKKAKKAEVLSHWYTLVDHFNIPCKDFYKGVKQELTLRKVPGLTISGVTFSEGGYLSGKRVYLRMKRERLVFDICAAPFGTSYFFSMRFAELPQGAAWWRWLPLVMGLACGWIAYDVLLVRGAMLVGALVVIAVMMLVLRTMIGFIEDHFLMDSYYRQDTRLMYLEIVNTVVKQKIAEFTSASGINLLDIKQHSPLMDDLYRTTQVNIEHMPISAEAPPEQIAA